MLSESFIFMLNECCYFSVLGYIDANLNVDKVTLGTSLVGAMKIYEKFGFVFEKHTPCSNLRYFLLYLTLPLHGTDHRTFMLHLKKSK